MLEWFRLTRERILLRSYGASIGALSAQSASSKGATASIGVWGFDVARFLYLTE